MLSRMQGSSLAVSIPLDSSGCSRNGERQITSDSWRCWFSPHHNWFCFFFFKYLYYDVQGVFYYAFPFFLVLFLIGLPQVGPLFLSIFSRALNWKERMSLFLSDMVLAIVFWWQTHWGEANHGGQMVAIYCSSGLEKVNSCGDEGIFFQVDCCSSCCRENKKMI